jgi:ubiquinone/menaquinone biosynthesis C-methylase UbiE
MDKFDFGAWPAGHLHTTPAELVIPRFFEDELLRPSDRESLYWYEENFKDYDDTVGLTFTSLGVQSEEEERKFSWSRLQLKEDSRVLEIGAGTGRDTLGIGRQLGKSGQLVVTDVHAEMLLINKAKLEAAEILPATYFLLADGHRLPFEDDFFDAVFHFGGLNTFSDPAEALREWSRVAKDGARIVFGDESIPMWMRGFETMQAVANSNDLFLHNPPLDSIPASARNLALHWFFNNGFYLIDYDEAKTPPVGNIDFKIPGLRGGTLRTRLHGQLEGVSPEAKEMLYTFSLTSGRSIHDLLNDIITGSLSQVMPGEES